MAPYKPVSHFGSYRKGNDITSGQKYIEPARKHTEHTELTEPTHIRPKLTGTIQTRQK